MVMALDRECKKDDDKYTKESCGNDKCKAFLGQMVAKAEEISAGVGACPDFQGTDHAAMVAGIKQVLRASDPPRLFPDPRRRPGGMFCHLRHCFAHTQTHRRHTAWVRTQSPLGATLLR